MLIILFNTLPVLATNSPLENLCFAAAVLSIALLCRNGAIGPIR